MCSDCEKRRRILGVGSSGTPEAITLGSTLPKLTKADTFSFDIMLRLIPHGGYFSSTAYSHLVYTYRKDENSIFYKKKNNVDWKVNIAWDSTERDAQWFFCDYKEQEEKIQSPYIEMPQEVLDVFGEAHEALYLIPSSFDWARSKEGFTHWREVREALEKLAEGKVQKKSVTQVKESENEYFDIPSESKDIFDKAWLFLDRHLTWRETKEGHEFWSDIRGQLFKLKNGRVKKAKK